MDKKELIKKNALYLFRQSGEVTIREISKESGVNIASINYYFGSKTNLLDELVDELLREIYGMLENIIYKTKSVDEQKKIFINELYSFASNSPGFLKFIVSLFTSHQHYDRLLKINMEFSKDIYKDFVGDMITKSTNITDEEEINNRIAIFFTSLTVSIITAEAINSPKKENDISFSRFMEVEPFTSFCNTLFDIILK